MLVKGPELSLTKYGQPAFKDKDGHLRTEARIRWWDGEATTLRDLAEIPPGAETKHDKPYPELPDDPCPDEAGYDYHGDEPVFYGHYWRTGETQAPAGLDHQDGLRRLQRRQGWTTRRLPVARGVGD